MIITQTLQDLVPSDLLPQLSDALARQAVIAIADQARDAWLQMAQNELHGQAALDYINGIQPVEQAQGSRYGREIRLVGVVPNVIEDGAQSYDMRKTLLGPNVPVVPVGSGLKGKHQSKSGGFYRAIPFSHSAPNSVGVTGTPIGRPYRNHADVANVKTMAAAIFKAAHKLAPTTGATGGGKITYGGRLPAGMAPLLKSHHKSDIYASMIRQEKTYRKATQSTFTTFRTISTKGGGWIRKAVAGRLFALKVSREVTDRIAPQTFAYLFKGNQK